MQDNAAMPGEHGLDHVPVLLVDSARHHSKATGGNAEVERRVIGVAHADAAAHAEDNLVGLAAMHDLVEQRQNGVASTVENTRAADVNHMYVRQDRNNLLGIC